MEEGKIATAWAQFGDQERSINEYKNVLPLSNTLLAGQVDPSARTSQSFY
jgi:hypothetical protein